jgi:hypothetical protein
MIFPRETIVVNERGCRAIVSLEDGAPILERRSIGYQGGKKWKAARLSFKLNHFDIPKTPDSNKEGLVLHHCDNDWCVEPGHIYLGSAKQNTKDMMERSSFRKNIGPALRGNQNAKGKHWTLSTETKRKMSEAAIANRENRARAGRMGGRGNKR